MPLKTAIKAQRSNTAMIAKHDNVAVVAKRGDTIIEVMFAFAIFTMVAIVSVMIMNSGIAASERSLELVTARNELNAQAEALRFIHSSYIAEMNLPHCAEGANVAANGDKCQQYEGLWNEIISDARLSATSNSPDKRYSIETPLRSCKDVYEEKDGQRNLLYQNNAFVINTRELLSENGRAQSIVRARSANGNSIFVEPLLGARLLYGNSYSSDTSADHMSDSGALVGYTTLLRAEGIWIVAVEGPRLGTATTPQYYDFYIDTCWYGAGASSPTTLDAVVRLYNPQGS